MKDTLASKTVQVALVFAGLGVTLIFADRAIDVATGAGLRYVPEFYGLLATMFGVLGAKNGADNFISYQREKTTMLASLPPNAPPQPTP